MDGESEDHPAAGFEAHLHADGVAFDGEDAALLRAVADRGSLNAAAEALGRSYSRAQKRVAGLEEAYGPLVERRRGGPGGGGSDLTDGARALLARFARLQTALTGTAAVDETVLAGTVRAREGELATVATPAGDVRAVLAADATAVQVTVRADAVTLHAPDGAPAADATSARNRFRGAVRAVDRGETVASVAVDVGADAPLTALVTTESIDCLSLAPGEAVVATCKATATRATPAEQTHGPATSDGAGE